MASLLIPVHNGEEVIKSKLENCLGLDYPGEELQIIAVSDASTDKTDEIIKSFETRGVKFLRLEERGGKSRALNLALRAVQTDLVFFTDASTLLKKDSLKNIAGNFADLDVGCVSGEDISIAKSSAKSEAGEGIYVELEMKLRRLESEVGNLVGVSGCLYGIRRKLVNEIPNDFIDDFYLPLDVVMQGKRVISEPTGIAFVSKVTSFKEEFRRRRRTTLGGLEVFFAELALLNPFKYGIFSLELFSHKLLRWLSPFFLVLLFLLSIALFRVHLFFLLTLVFAFSSVFLAVIYLLFSINRRPPRTLNLIEPVFYFYLVNIAMLLAWVKFVLGQREIMWEPSKR
jgi:cellulose synthase/poly-beta-1,6-N-acetylglucosamine synthase-like glycosyltransferase